jgi:hypothetical protein
LHLQLGYITQEFLVYLGNNSDIGTWLVALRFLHLWRFSLWFCQYSVYTIGHASTASIDHSIVVEDDMQLLVLHLQENGVMKRGNVAVKRGTVYRQINTDEMG